jgi:hypothetical protein
MLMVLSLAIFENEFGCADISVNGVGFELLRLRYYLVPV